jgi:hypothetical protein
MKSFGLFVIINLLHLVSLLDGLVIGHLLFLIALHNLVEFLFLTLFYRMIANHKSIVYSLIVVIIITIVVIILFTIFIIIVVLFFHPYNLLIIIDILDRYLIIVTVITVGIIGINGIF